MSLMRVGGRVRLGVRVKDRVGGAGFRVGLPRECPWSRERGRSAAVAWSGLGLGLGLVLVSGLGLWFELGFGFGFGFGFGLGLGLTGPPPSAHVGCHGVPRESAALPLAPVVAAPPKLLGVRVGVRVGATVRVWATVRVRGQDGRWG